MWTRRGRRAQGAAECTANLEVRPIEGVDARQESDCGERLSSGLNSAGCVFGGGGNGGVLRPVLRGSQGRRHAKGEEVGRHHVSSEGPQLPARVQPGANTMYTIYGIQITFAESGYICLSRHGLPLFQILVCRMAGTYLDLLWKASRKAGWGGAKPQLPFVFRRAYRASTLTWSDGSSWVVPARFFSSFGDVSREENMRSGSEAFTVASQRYITPRTNEAA